MTRKALLLTATIIMASNCYAQDLESYREKYDDTLSRITVAYQQRIETITKSYSTGLNALKARVQSEGNLDKLKAVMEEISRFALEKTLPAEEDNPIHESLALVQNCQANTTEAEKAKAQRIVVLASQYDKALLSLQKEHTRKGEIVKATAIQEERKALAEAAAVIAARAVLAQNAPVQQPRPVPREAAKPVYLSDLRERDVHVGWGSFGKNGNLGYEDGKIVVDGKLSDKGLSMHPPSRGSSRVSYDIDGKYRWFHARPSLNDTSRGSITAITFSVLGDGKALWSSKPLQRRDDLENIEVDISGVKELRIEVNCPGPFKYAHAVWIDPRLLR